MPCCEYSSTCQHFATISAYTTSICQCQCYTKPFSSSLNNTPPKCTLCWYPPNHNGTRDHDDDDSDVVSTLHTRTYAVCLSMCVGVAPRARRIYNNIHIHGIATRERVCVHNSSSSGSSMFKNKDDLMPKKVINFVMVSFERMRACVPRLRR